jgi:hypothetical protein
MLRNKELLDAFLSRLAVYFIHRLLLLLVLPFQFRRFFLLGNFVLCSNCLTFFLHVTNRFKAIFLENVVLPSTLSFSLSWPQNKTKNFKSFSLKWIKRKYFLAMNLSREKRKPSRDPWEILLRIQGWSH